ncbi:MAG: hypothetical protein HY812_15945 [Planctomycetes bacterium]|nr:hypothetical protein [Planctomycetota bacterium]
MSETRPKPFLLQKTVLAGLCYSALCLGLLAHSRHERLALLEPMRSALVRELLSTERPPADVLFLGSSRTARAVIPEAFEQRYEELTGERIRALNLAMLGKAKHINYLTLVEYLSVFPPPKAVFLEVGSIDHAEHPHEITARFMNLADILRVLGRMPYRTRSYERSQELILDPPDNAFDSFFLLLERGFTNVDLAMEGLGRGPEDEIFALYCRGKNAWAGLLGGAGAGRSRLEAALEGFKSPYTGDVVLTSVADLSQQIRDQGWYRVKATSSLYQKGKKQVDEWQDAPVGNPNFQRMRLPIDYRAPGRYAATFLYTDTFVSLCRKHGIRLIQMEIPGFWEEAMSGSQVAYYRRKAELYQPPDWTIYVKENYADVNHLDEDGAAKFTRALAQLLAKPPHR